MKGIFFHYFTDDNNINCQGALNKTQFENIIKYILSNYKMYQPSDVTLETLNTKDSTNSVCLCFNCGLKSQVEIALPVLEKYNIRAFWMLCSNVFENKIVKIETYHHFRFFSYNNLDDFYSDFFNIAKLYLNSKGKSICGVIKEMHALNYLAWSNYYTFEDKLYRYLRDFSLCNEYDLIMEKMMKKKNYNPYDYFERLWMNISDIEMILEKKNIIGLHSHTHPNRIELLDYEEQYYEYRKNKEILESITGTNITSMSHPSNSYNEDTISILNELGITIGFQSKNPNSKSNLSIPTIDHSEFLNNYKMIR